MNVKQLLLYQKVVKNMNESTFEDLFLGRRSIRNYDSSHKISRTEMSQILAEATRAPSSQNLQPWHFVVVDSFLGKEKIKPAMMFNSQQTETASAVIFIFGDLDPTKRVKKIMHGPVTNGTMTEENRAYRVNQLKDYYHSIPQETIRETAILDGGLVAMSLMIAARQHGLDTCAIGGFDKTTIGNLLGVDAERYFPIVALSIGKAIEEGFESFRLPTDDITTYF